MRRNNFWFLTYLYIYFRNYKDTWSTVYGPNRIYFYVAFKLIAQPRDQQKQSVFRPLVGLKQETTKHRDITLNKHHNHHYMCSGVAMCRLCKNYWWASLMVISTNSHLIASHITGQAHQPCSASVSRNMNNNKPTITTTNACLPLQLQRTNSTVSKHKLSAY